MSSLFFLPRLDSLDDTLATKASALGFTVLRVPVFATEPGKDSLPLARRLSLLGDGVALAWTSRRAADSLARSLAATRSSLPRFPMYALGEESAAPLRRSGYAPLTLGEGARAADLARFIAGRVAEDGVRRVIFLGGDRSLPDLPNGLEAAGIEVTRLEIYRTHFLNADVDGLMTCLANKDPVAAAFFSPSGVTGLERLLGAEAREQMHTRAAVIARGHTTASDLMTRGYQNIFTPEGALGFERVALDVLEATCGERR